MYHSYMPFLLPFQTLNLVVDNGEEIFPCKALDCDTITQVKAKCIDQIYVNFAASKLPMDVSMLNLGTAKPELAVTFIKQPSCHKQPNIMFPNLNFVLDIHLR